MIFVPGICVQRSTAPGPRIPSPIKPTRTVSIGGAVNRMTFFCPVGRTGISVCMDVVLLFFCDVQAV